MKSEISETPKQFFVWLDRRLDELGLNDNRLAIKAGISNSVISKARSGLQPIGFDACKKLAGPLGVSTEHILRLAGHLEPEPGWSPERDEWNHLFGAITDEQREMLLTTARNFANQGKRHGKKAQAGRGLE